MKRYLLAAVAAVLVLSPSAKGGSDAGKVKVVRKQRIGNNVEDITFVANGKHKGQVAAMNGWDVFGIKLKVEDDDDDAEPGEREARELPPGVHKLFDVRRLAPGTLAAPRGIEFVPTQKPSTSRAWIRGSRTSCSSPTRMAVPCLPFGSPIPRA